MKTAFPITPLQWRPVVVKWGHVTGSHKVFLLMVRYMAKVSIGLWMRYALVMVNFRFVLGLRHKMGSKGMEINTCSSPRIAEQICYFAFVCTWLLFFLFVVSVPVYDFLSVLSMLHQFLTSILLDTVTLTKEANHCGCFFIPLAFSLHSCF